MGKWKAGEQQTPPPLHRRAPRGQARARISLPSAAPPAPPSPAASSGSCSSSHNVRAAVQQQQISLQNGNLSNLMDHAARNELMQKREEIAHLHLKIQHIDDDLQATVQWKNYEMGIYRMLISQLSRMQGTNAQGHGLTNELEYYTGSGNQAMNVEGSQGTVFAQNTSPTLTCSICYFRGACMLILPCQHLCACKSCEVNLTLCPVCGSAKTNAIEARFG